MAEVRLGDLRGRKESASALTGAVSAAGGLWNPGLSTASKRAAQIRQWQDGTRGCEFGHPDPGTQRSVWREPCQQQNGTRQCEFGHPDSGSQRSVCGNLVNSRLGCATPLVPARTKSRPPACVDGSQPDPVSRNRIPCQGTESHVTSRTPLQDSGPGVEKPGPVSGDAGASRNVRDQLPGAGALPLRSECSCSTGPCSRSSALPRPDRLGLFMK